MSEIKEQLTMNAANLFREETFTDQKVGSLRRLTPVDADGNTRPETKPLFIGQTQVMSSVGPVPISFELDVSNLEEAAEQFAEAAEQEIERTMQELQEMRRQQQSSIMVPGQGGAPGAGGMPPAGGIQMP